MEVDIGLTTKFIGTKRNIHCENSICSFVIESCYQSNVSFLIELFMFFHCPVESIFIMKMKVGDVLTKYCTFITATENIHFENLVSL